MALYYNTISLHDGNYMLGQYSGRSSMQTYKIRLARLSAFMQKIAQSGRRVVVLVPEHGAAFRGDRMQISGLRKIPTPALTLVPVGIKVVGPDISRDGDPVSIDAPSSFLAMSAIVSKVLAKSPYDSKSFSPLEYANDLPVTEYVAENQNMLMIRRNNRYYLRQDPDGWSEYMP